MRGIMIERKTIYTTFHFCLVCDSMKVEFDDHIGWSCKECKNTGFEPIKKEGKIVYYW